MNALATRYAGALLDVAAARDQVDAVAGDLEQVHAVLEAEPRIVAALAGPETSAEQRRSLLDKLAAGRHELVANTLHTLERRQRLGLLEALWPAFRALLRARRDEAVGVVETARPLDEAQRGAVQELAGRLAGGRSVHLDFHDDPELIGGVRLKLGNTLYDGSVASALQGLRRRLETAPLS